MTKRQKAKWETKLDELVKEREARWLDGKPADWRLDMQIKQAQQKLGLI